MKIIVEKYNNKNKISLSSLNNRVEVTGNRISDSEDITINWPFIQSEQPERKQTEKKLTESQGTERQ